MSDASRLTISNLPTFSILADRLKKAQQFGAKPFGYENPPVEMLMNLLGVPAVQQTMERMAYGEPLTTGSGMTTKPRPEAIEAAMTLLPASVGLAKATKGLPVGASIKNVGKDVDVSLNEASNFLSAKSKFGEVGGTIRQPDKLSDKPYLQINYAEVEQASRGTGKGKELYKALIDEAESMGLRVFSDSTVEKSAVNVYKSLEKGGYKLKDMTKGSLEDGAVYGSGAEKPAFEISNIQKLAPRQEALDTAQRNAALPIEEGGLGLPKDNTPEMRAEAMGYKTPVYHGTNEDINIFNVEGKGKTSGAGAFFTTNPTAAETYVSGSGGGNILPLLLRQEDFLTANAKGRNWADIYTNELGAKAGKKRYSLEDLELDRDSATSTDELGIIASNLGLKGAEIRNVKDLGPNSHVMRAKEYLSDRYGITPDETWSNVSGKQFDEAQKYMKQFYESQKGDIYAIQDPSLLRSRNAAFDPMRRNEGDILAGVLPLGLLADEEQRKKLYELMPSLLGQ